MCRPQRRAARAVARAASGAAATLEDPELAERLRAAQERIRIAKLNLKVMRDSLVDQHADSEPLDRRFMASVLGLFGPESAAPMRPLLDRALSSALAEIRDTEALSALVCSMAMARLPYEPAWRSVGDAVIELCPAASGPQLVEMAWAFATAGEQRPELFAALKASMVAHAGGLEDKMKRTFAWACAEVGEHAVDTFGEPSVNAPAEASRTVLTSLTRLVARGVDAEALCSVPLPVVAVPGVVPEAAGHELIALADEGGLWRSSSRRGARSAEGIDALRTSQSAVLSSPAHMDHPVTKSVRGWVASTLGVPMSYIEALQLVRYNRGEQYGAHVDWGQVQDASLWLGGQRTATALIYLNSMPEGCGGETVFPHLGVSVTPRAGTAVLWPNVDAAGVPQQLVEHQAMPVLCDTTKYAVNVWVRGQELPSYAGATAA